MNELTAKKFSWFFRVSRNSLFDKPMMPMESTCSCSSSSSSSSSLRASLRSLQRRRKMSGLGDTTCLPVEPGSSDVARFLGGVALTMQDGTSRMIGCWTASMQFAWKGAQGEFLLSNRNEISFSTIESYSLMSKTTCKRWRQPVVVRKLSSLRTCVTAWIAFAAQRPPWTWPEDVRSVSCKKNHHYRPHRDQSTSRGKMETAWLSSIVPEKVNLFLVWDFSHQRLSRTYGTIEVQEKHSYNYQQYHFASSSSSSSPEWCWRSLRRNGRPSLTRVPGGPFHYD